MYLESPSSKSAFLLSHDIHHPPRNFAWTPCTAVPVLENLRYLFTWGVRFLSICTLFKFSIPIITAHHLYQWYDKPYPSFSQIDGQVDYLLPDRGVRYNLTISLRLSLRPAVILHFLIIQGFADCAYVHTVVIQPVIMISQLWKGTQLLNGKQKCRVASGCPESSQSQVGFTHH